MRIDWLLCTHAAYPELGHIVVIVDVIVVVVTIVVPVIYDECVRLIAPDACRVGRVIIDSAVRARPHVRHTLRKVKLFVKNKFEIN